MSLIQLAMTYRQAHGRAASLIPKSRPKVHLPAHSVPPSTRGTNLKMCDRTKSIVRGVRVHQELARTVRSSSKVSNPTFQPLIGAQEPTPPGVGSCDQSEPSQTQTVLSLQRDPKWLAKKNGCQMAPGVDIFSKLPPILRSAGTSVYSSG